MDFLTSFQRHIKARQFFQKEDRLLLAVSGGMDSMVLAHLLLKSGFSFSVAHMNFQLRGLESDGDEQFVKNWGLENGVEVFSKKVNTEKYAALNKLGIQEAARKLRYDWFEELSVGQGFSRILTAHHADDDIETALHLYFRGTGLRGLAGIRPVREKIVRPLLFAGRIEIEAFATLNNIRFRNDASNLLDKYTRNFIRLQVIPLLQKNYPTLNENILDNILRFSRLADEVDKATVTIIKKLEVREKGILKYPVQALLKSLFRSQVLIRILQNAGFNPTQLPELEKLLQSDSGKYLHSSTHRILKDRKWIIISSPEETDATFFVIEKSDQIIKTSSGEFLQMPADGFKPVKDRFSEIIDATGLSYPLILRKWKTGDYFYPLGMKHKKKLSRFFIDQKLSVHEKENTWVLESGRRIVWVLGQRIDERFAVRKNTVPLLKISWKPL